MERNAMKKKRKRADAAALLAGLLCGLLLYASAPLLDFAGRTQQPAPPEPAYELTGFWGDFDEIRLFRYYLLSDVPDASGIPAQDAGYGGKNYEFVSADGPVDMGFGPCWEAMYREVEK